MKEGFTVVEVLVALVILSFGILGVASTGGRLAYTTVAIDRRAIALQSIEDRIAEIKAHPDYASLDSVFTASMDSVPGASGMFRSTSITRTQNPGTGGRVIDFTTITISAFGSVLADTLTRSTIVSVQ